MSQQITTAFVKEYTQGITILQQQMFSNLRGAVGIESGITGDSAFFDQIAATAMSAVGNRHGDTPLTDTPHRRRRVDILAFDVADMVDRPDKVRTLNDPTNPYVRQFAAAAGRQTDDFIIDAFDATVATGVAGGGSDAFDTDFSISSDFGASDSNLTTAKLREARRILEAAENPEDGADNQWYVVAGASQRAGLLGDTNFIDADFNSVKALVDGEVDTWLGFKFLKSERLPVSSSERSVFAWRKASMTLAIGAEPRGFIDVRPDKRHGVQVRYEMDMGAVRMDQVGVVRILCDE